MYHPDETHYACDVALKEGNSCCGCTQHQCVEAGAEGFLSQPQNTLNIIENAKREVVTVGSRYSPMITLRAHLKRISSLGGKARAKKLTPERRKEIATKASHSRSHPSK